MSTGLTGLIVQGVHNRDVLQLARFSARILTEGRLTEAVYGAYCFLRYRPSAIVGGLSDALIPVMRQKAQELALPHLYQARELPKIFPKHAAAGLPFHRIPSDVVVRRSSVVSGDDWMVLGEYGDQSGRLFLLLPHQYYCDERYNQMREVRHIHSILMRSETELLVSTGDSGKRLDSWQRTASGLTFERCVHRRFAGYTGAAKVRGKHYFGTDFSSRPNFIYCLESGKMWPLPGRSFTKYVRDFAVVDERYIVSYNVSFDVVDTCQMASVFDVERECFVLDFEVA
jgi:hypothetical protein